MTDGNATVVVHEVEALDDAYAKGYDTFEYVPDAEGEAPVDNDDLIEAVSEGTHSTLRAAAGFGDSGRGTYAEDRLVAVVPVGCEGDEPAECTVISASEFLDIAIRSEWKAGALDAVNGRDRGHSVERASRIDPQ